MGKILLFLLGNVLTIASDIFAEIIFKIFVPISPRHTIGDNLLPHLMLL